MTTADALATALRAIPDIIIEWRSFPDRSKPVTIEDLCAAILAAEPRLHLDPAGAVSVDEHKPGDPHQYRITCSICGERGTIRLTVDPEKSEPS